MKYTTKAAEKSTVKITMKFDGEEWKNAITKAYNQNKHKYSVPGFRKGKAPLARIGKEVFYEDALNILFSENYGTVLDKKAKDFTVVGEPEVSIENFTDEEIVLVAVAPVKPEVKINSYKGMKIQKFEYTVKDEEVEAELQRLRDRNART